MHHKKKQGVSSRDKETVRIVEAILQQDPVRLGQHPPRLLQLLFLDCWGVHLASNERPSQVDVKFLRKIAAVRGLVNNEVGSRARLVAHLPRRHRLFVGRPLCTRLRAPSGRAAPSSPRRSARSPGRSSWASTRPRRATCRSTRTRRSSGTGATRPHSASWLLQHFPPALEPALHAPTPASCSRARAEALLLSLSLLPPLALPPRPSCRDSSTVQCDVDRSLWHYTQDWTEEKRAAKRAALQRVLNGARALLPPSLPPPLTHRGRGASLPLSATRPPRFPAGVVGFHAGDVYYYQARPRPLPPALLLPAPSFPPTTGVTLSLVLLPPRGPSARHPPRPQGLHDVASIVLLVCGEEAAFPLVERLVLHHLRDCTRRARRQWQR